MARPKKSLQSTATNLSFETTLWAATVLTPGRYVGAEDALDDGEPFSEKMIRLTTRLSGQMAESERLGEEIRKNLTGIGFPI